ncbi:hypothetical protein LEMLEM_LOCUS3543 [Lemmus lemmus]
MLLVGFECCSRPLYFWNLSVLIRRKVDQKLPFCIF